jgi:hypothetical protein
VTEILLGKLALALLGAAALGRDAWRRQRGRAGSGRWLYAGLGALGLVAYSNFGTLHQGRFLHIWDTYHYYIGAKYFSELGYQRLYECTAVADAEAGLRRDTALRTMTDLRSNERTTTLLMLSEPTRCTRHFSDARWRQFQRDVAWFRARVDAETWRRIQRDHGYNATPVWQALGGWLCNLGPASERLIVALALIDPLLLLAALLTVWRCFGGQVFALAGLLLGTFYPCQFAWNGGALLRMDWLSCALLGLCALRRERAWLAGALLGYAALLRLFPAALLVGPGLAALLHGWRTRRLHPVHTRVLAGAALTAALLLVPTLWLSGDGGRGFVANTEKHAATPLTNHMGLPTLLAYRPATTVRELRAQQPRELWPTFKRARRQAAQRGAPWVALAALGCLLLVAHAGRRAPSHVAALAALLIPCALQLTCYYYIFVLLLTPLAERRTAPALVLLLTSAATQALALALASRVGIDELYVAMTAVTLVGLGVLVTQLAPEQRARRSDRTGYSLAAAARSQLQSGHP